MPESQGRVNREFAGVIDWREGQIDDFQNELVGVAKRMEREIRSQVENFTTQGGDFVGDEFTLGRADALRGQLDDILVASGYQESVGRFMSKTPELQERVSSAWLNSGFEHEFTQVDQDAFKLITGGAFEDFANVGADGLGLIRTRLLDAVTGQENARGFAAQLRALLASQSDTLKDRAGRGMFRHAGTLAETSLAQLHRFMDRRAGESVGIEQWIYLGGIIETSRPFCIDLSERTRVGQSWDMKQIEKMDNGQMPKGTVFETGGGWRCRHQWVPLVEDVDEAVARTLREKVVPAAEKTQQAARTVERVAIALETGIAAADRGVLLAIDLAEAAETLELIGGGATLLSDRLKRLSGVQQWLNGNLVPILNDVRLGASTIEGAAGVMAERGLSRKLARASKTYVSGRSLVDSLRNPSVLDAPHVRMAGEPALHSAAAEAASLVAIFAPEIPFILDLEDALEIRVREAFKAWREDPSPETAFDMESIVELIRQKKGLDDGELLSIATDDVGRITATRLGNPSRPAIPTAVDVPPTSGPADLPGEVRSILRDQGLGPSDITIASSNEEALDLARRFGPPNSVDVGGGVFGGRAGRLFVDDSRDGRPVGYAPPATHAFTEVPPREIVPIYSEELVGAHSGQQNLVIRAFDRDTGDALGRIEYADFEGAPHIGIIEVDELSRRQGVGIGLLERLQESYPNTRIDYGGLTGDGAGLKRAYEAKLIEADPHSVRTQQLVSGNFRALDFDNTTDARLDTGLFIEARDLAAEKTGRSGYLSHTTIDEFEEAGAKLFLSEDGRIGYALDREGDLQNVFAWGVPGGGKWAVFDAIERGARKLDHFEGFLGTRTARNLPDDFKPGTIDQAQATPGYLYRVTTRQGLDADISNQDLVPHTPGELDIGDIWPNGSQAEEVVFSATPDAILIDLAGPEASTRSHIVTRIRRDRFPESGFREEGGFVYRTDAINEIPAYTLEVLDSNGNWRLLRSREDGYYTQFGFRESGRLVFSDEFAPDDWLFGRDGRPDIILRTFEGGDRGTVRDRFVPGRPLSRSPRAARIAEAELAEGQARPGPGPLAERQVGFPRSRVADDVGLGSSVEVEIGRERQIGRSGLRERLVSIRYADDAGRSISEPAGLIRYYRGADVDALTILSTVDDFTIRNPKLYERSLQLLAHAHEPGLLFQTEFTLRGRKGLVRRIKGIEPEGDFDFRLRAQPAPERLPDTPRGSPAITERAAAVAERLAVRDGLDDLYDELEGLLLAERDYDVPIARFVEIQRVSQLIVDAPASVRTELRGLNPRRRSIDDAATRALDITDTTTGDFSVSVHSLSNEVRSAKSVTAIGVRMQESLDRSLDALQDLLQARGEIAQIREQAAFLVDGASTTALSLERSGARGAALHELAKEINGITAGQVAAQMNTLSLRAIRIEVQFPRIKRFASNTVMSSDDRNVVNLLFDQFQEQIEGGRVNPETLRKLSELNERAQLFIGGRSTTRQLGMADVRRLVRHMDNQVELDEMVTRIRERSAIEITARAHRRAAERTTAIANLEAADTQLTIYHTSLETDRALRGEAVHALRALADQMNELSLPTALADAVGDSPRNRALLASLRSIYAAEHAPTGVRDLIRESRIRAAARLTDPSAGVSVDTITSELIEAIGANRFAQVHLDELLAKIETGGISNVAFGELKKIKLAARLEAAGDVTEASAALAAKRERAARFVDEFKQGTEGANARLEAVRAELFPEAITRSELLTQLQEFEDALQARPTPAVVREITDRIEANASQHGFIRENDDGLLTTGGRDVAEVLDQVKRIESDGFSVRMIQSSRRALYPSTMIDDLVESIDDFVDALDGSDVAIRAEARALARRFEDSSGIDNGSGRTIYEVMAENERTSIILGHANRINDASESGVEAAIASARRSRRKIQASPPRAISIYRDRLADLIDILHTAGDMAARRVPASSIGRVLRRAQDFGLDERLAAINQDQGVMLGTSRGTRIKAGLKMLESLQPRINGEGTGGVLKQATVHEITRDVLHRNTWQKLIVNLGPERAREEIAIMIARALRELENGTRFAGLSPGTLQGSDLLLQLASIPRGQVSLSLAPEIQEILQTITTDLLPISLRGQRALDNWRATGGLEWVRKNRRLIVDKLPQDKIEDGVVQMRLFRDQATRRQNVLDLVDAIEENITANPIRVGERFDDDLEALLGELSSIDEDEYAPLTSVSVSLRRFIADAKQLYWDADNQVVPSGVRTRGFDEGDFADGLALESNVPRIVHEIAKGANIDILEAVAFVDDLQPFWDEIGEVLTPEGLWKWLIGPQMDEFSTFGSISVETLADDAFTFTLRGDLHAPNGDRGEFARTLDLRRGYAHHDLMDMPEALRDGVKNKASFKRQKEFYDAAGIDYIDVQAAMGNGAYTWSKYGFLPKGGNGQLEFVRLKWFDHYGPGSGLRNRVAAVDSPAAELIDDLLEESEFFDNEHLLWDVADLSDDFDGLFGTIGTGDRKRNKTLGQELLAGHHWSGEINLSNVEQAERWDDYVKGVRVEMSVADVKLAARLADEIAEEAAELEALIVTARRELDTQSGVSQALMESEDGATRRLGETQLFDIDRPSGGRRIELEALDERVDRFRVSSAEVRGEITTQIEDVLEEVGTWVEEAEDAATQILLSAEEVIEQARAQFQRVQNAILEIATEAAELGVEVDGLTALRLNVDILELRLHGSGGASVDLGSVTTARRLAEETESVASTVDVMRRNLQSVPREAARVVVGSGRWVLAVDFQGLTTNMRARVNSVVHEAKRVGNTDMRAKAELLEGEIQEFVNQVSGSMMVGPRITRERLNGWSTRYIELYDRLAELDVPTGVFSRGHGEAGINRARPTVHFVLNAPWQSRVVSSNYVLRMYDEMKRKLNLLSAKVLNKASTLEGAEKAALDAVFVEAEGILNSIRTNRTSLDNRIFRGELADINVVEEADTLSSLWTKLLDLELKSGIAITRDDLLDLDISLIQS